MKVLTPEQDRFYREQGYIIIENFLSPAQVQVLKKALESLVDEKAKNMNKDQDGFNLEKKPLADGERSPFQGEAVAAGVLRKIQDITRHSPEFAALAESDQMLNMVEDLIGQTIYYHSSKLMFKPAHHGSVKPWHQDYAYWASTRPEQVTCWIPLDDATPENGCMQLIPGSHKWGLVKHEKEELQVDAKSLPMDQVKIAPMKAGSLLAFHVLTFHYSGPNTSDQSRRAFIVDYDPNQRPVKGGLAGDRLLRIQGRKPSQEEVREHSAPVRTAAAV